MDCTGGAIVLQPNGNSQGRYYFYSILTGHRLSCRSWTELSISDESVQRIEKMPCRSDHVYNFTYRDGNAIIDDDDADDSIYSPSYHEDDDEHPSLHYDKIIEPEIAGVDDNINDDDADNNTDDANTDVHDDSGIIIKNKDEPNTNCADTNYNADLIQPPNDYNTEDEYTNKNDNAHDIDVLDGNDSLYES